MGFALSKWPHFNRVYLVAVCKWSSAAVCNLCSKQPYLYSRGWVEKKFPNILPNNAKMVNPTVKPWAKCQIDFFRTLIWGVVHPFIWNTFRDTLELRKLIVY